MGRKRGVFIGWSLAGCQIEEGPISAREAKPIGAVIHVRGLIRKFRIYHREDDDQPWKLRETAVVGTKNPCEIEDELSQNSDDFTSLRQAMRGAIELARA